MADEEDLFAVRAGEIDLVARDLRNSDLSGLNISFRDLSNASISGSRLNGVDLSGANCSDINFFKVQAIGITAIEIIAKSSIFHMSDFSKSNFTNASFVRSHFSDAKFSSAVLIGADFTDCNFDDNISDFSDSITDETTKFDNARASRAQARQPAFRYYKVERGRLVRKDADVPSDHSAELEELAAAAAAAKATLEKIKLESSRPSGIEIGIGHNRPPSNQALAAEQVRLLDENLNEIIINSTKVSRDKKRLSAAIENLKPRYEVVSHWCSEQLKVFSTEFAKNLGKEAATTKFWLGIWLMLSGQLGKVLEIAVNVLTK